MIPARLHTKFLVLILGSLICLLALLSYVIASREARLREQNAVEKQSILAFAIYSNLRENMIQRTPRSSAALMDSLRGTYGVVHVDTLRRDGSPAFSSRKGRHESPRLGGVFETGEGVSFRENAGQVLQTFLYPFLNGPDCVRCHKQRKVLGVLRISVSMDHALEEIAAGSRRLAVSLAALILIIGSILYVVIRKVVLRPLAVLHKGAERIGRGDLSHRIELSTNDEIQDLAGSFNVMAGHLEETYSGQEKLIQERTREAEDKARKLYDYSRDLATISRLSTKVFDPDQSLDELLDRFIRAVRRGLGYREVMLCLIDRRHSRLDVKRDTGLGRLLVLAKQDLAGADPFPALVLSASEVYVRDIRSDPVFSTYLAAGCSESRSLHVVPLLSGTNEKPCWKEKSCTRTDCPAYNQEDKRCWTFRNTLCSDTPIESCGGKLAYCMTCDVFPVLGSLVVACPPGRPFRRRDVSVLRILAADMSAALENHRLHDQNRRLVKELLELHTVSAAALSELRPDRVLSLFSEWAVKLSGLDECNFWLLSEDDRELVHTARGCRAPAPAQCPARLPADEGILGRAFSEDRMITEYDAAAKDPTELGRTAALNGYRSLLALPLKAETKPIGVFSIHKKDSPPFLESELAAFMLLANHAAMAINICILNAELKTQNRELAEKSNLLSGILENMSSGLMLLNLDGTIRIINNAGAALFDCRPDELEDSHLMERFAGAADILKAASGPYKESEVVRNDGTNIPIGYSIAHYHGSSGQPEGKIVIFRDLTEIKVLQAAVLNKERFAAMGRVVAGVAHEIRNPLFGISSIGQIFERELKNPGHLNLVQALLSETKRLNNLVEELLLYGRPKKLSLTWCDLTSLWKDVIGIHGGEMAQRRITVEDDFAVALRPAFLDQNQIRQVFLNLLRNAIDATPDNGRIRLSLLLEDRHIIFRVSDSGAGIPPENIDKIFDLFFTTKPKGTGLGLAICKKILEDHGGMICVESRQGARFKEDRGTSVVIKLPYRGMPESAHNHTP